MKNTHLLALALLGMALSLRPAAAQGASPTDEAGAHLDRGASLLYQGKYDEAIVELEAALALRPDYAKARLNLATAYFYKKDYVRAEKESLACLKQDPSYVNARFNLAIVYQAQGKDDEALAAYRRVLESDPKRAQVWKNMARIHQRQGELRRAVEAYERSLAIDPGQPDAADLRRTADQLRVKIVDAARAAEATTPAPPAEATAAPAAPAAPEAAAAVAMAPSPSPTSDAPPPPAPPETPTSVAPGLAAAPSPAPPPGPEPSPPHPGTAVPGATPAPTPAPAATPAPTAAPAAPPPSTPARAAAPEAGPPAATAPHPTDPEVLRKLLSSVVATRREGATLVASAPLGAEVYVRKEDIQSRDPFPRYGAFGAHKKSRQYLALRSDIVDKKSYRGQTPLTLELEEGHYQIAFRLPGHRDVWIEDGNAYVHDAALSLTAADLPTDVKVYEISVHAYDRPQSVVALFQKKTEGAAQVAVSCGDGSFVVDEPGLSAMLAGYTLPAEEVAAAPKVLRCTGKAVLLGEKANVMVEVTVPGRLRVSRTRK